MSYVVFHVATKRSDRSLKKEIASYQGDSAMGEYLKIQEMLREGESYAGLILGKDGEADYHLVLLPEEASDVSWPTASEWAAGRDAGLPNRRELALLFANQREQFDRVWYWSSEQHETRPQLVWGQNFASGIQTVYGRPFRGHARAVRRLNV